MTDVANAIVDGTDVTMLSAETSIGKQPGIVHDGKIIVETEKHLPSPRILDERAGWQEKNVEGIISLPGLQLLLKNQTVRQLLLLQDQGLQQRRVSGAGPEPGLALTDRRLQPAMVGYSAGHISSDNLC